MIVRIFLRILLSALLCSGGVSQAIDTSDEERACAEIGFMPKTEKFASCVLELYERSTKSSAQRSLTINGNASSKGDGSVDDQTCQKYGFKLSSVDYSNCRMQIDMARTQAQRDRARFQAEMATYEQMLAEQKRQQEKARAMRQLELGLRMMGGQSPIDAVNSIGTGAPLSRPAQPIQQQSIRLPNGTFIQCTTTGSVTNCF